MNQRSEKNISENLKEYEEENISKSKISENILRYKKTFSEKLEKIIKRLDYNQKLAVIEKIEQIINNPFHNYKFLHYNMKGQSRVHIGHFVLVFRIEHDNKNIYFDDYEHHDKIYK